MANGNGPSWIKVASLSAVGGLIVVIITILSYGGSVVDEKIDNKIIVHTSETELVHQENIAEIKQKLAILGVVQKEVQKDIAEQKTLTQENFEELKKLIRNGQ